MGRMLCRIGFVMAALCGVAAPVLAQDRVVPYARSGPPLSEPGIGVRVFGTFGYDVMTAKKTYDAVLGSSVVQEIGGGAEVTNLPGGLFARVAGQRVRESGARVFIVNGKVVSTGIPLTVQMTPIEVAAGWRSGSKASGFSFFAGAGALFMSYKETSAGASASENVSDRFPGYLALAGIDVTIARHVFFGGEAQYRIVPNALGDAGVSADFRETDLGGVVARLRIGIAF